MSVRAAIQLMILAILFFAAGSAFAQNPNTQPNIADTKAVDNQNVSEQASDDHVWRCSMDGKYYTVTYSNGLQIRPIGSGQITANVPLRTDKKGHSKLEGQWGSGAYSGLIVIQGMEQDYVGGHMLVPTAGAPPSACNSRKASVIFSLGQPQPICNVVSISWNLQPNVSAAQVANEEMLHDIQAANSSAAQTSGVSDVTTSSVDGSLVGTWSNESVTAVSYAKTRLILRADGTYTKTLGARPPTMGGGVAGAPTLGDTHSGTWSTVGPMQVRLSGDSQHTPYTQDLRSLIKQ
jgi:hypothetical protein